MLEKCIAINLSTRYHHDMRISIESILKMQFTVFLQAKAPIMAFSGSFRSLFAWQKMETGQNCQPCSKNEIKRNRSATACIPAGPTMPSCSYCSMIRQQLILTSDIIINFYDNHIHLQLSLTQRKREKELKILKTI